MKMGFMVNHRNTLDSPEEKLIFFLVRIPLNIIGRTNDVMVKERRT